MNTLIDIWCVLPTRVRIACWCLWSLSLCAMAAICIIGMGSPERDERLHQRSVLRGQWQNLHHLANSVDEHLIVADNTIPPFSPLRFQVPQIHLQYWKPTVQGGEMALKGPWGAVPQVFNQLAQQGMGVSQFSCRIEDAGLLLTLQLEQPYGG